MALARFPSGDGAGQLDAQIRTGSSYDPGLNFDPGDGQPRIAARLVRVLPEIAVWAASLPPGIVAVEPWLTPAGDDRGITPEPPAARSETPHNR